MARGLSSSARVTASAWPSVRSSVHDVPIAVAGPPVAVRQVTAAGKGVTRRRPGGPNRRPGPRPPAGDRRGR
ncbi:hypothetical protein E1281_13105 [Actinomadura sp. KC345]|nr:hypothetical protein E1281_13105 [Actinomadura sp. KC345]